MSRIGKAPIAIPKGVTVTKAVDSVVVKGPKGELRQPVHPGFEFSQEAGTLSIGRPSDAKPHRALHGLYRALTANMITGVTDGFKLNLELVGVGYKAEIKTISGVNVVDLALGYSHAIYFVLPPEVKAEAEIKKGETPKLILSGIDKQLVGQVAAKIRKLRAPEPYKGKGIRFVGEQIRRKAGKSAGKGGKK
jgi:large subunit ribosomal protein L6